MSPVPIALIFILVAPFVLAAPALDAATLKMNGEHAQLLNAQFALLKKTDSCEGTEMACVESAFAQCVSGKWETTECSGGTQCFVLPLVNKAGTSISCDTKADAEARISNTGVPGGLTGSGSHSLSTSLAVGSNSSSNSTVISSSMNDTGTDTGGASTDCNGDVTVTVTVTRSSQTFTAASATLAPGFTLPPPGDVNATTTTSGASSLATTLPLNSTDTDAYPSSTLETTLTLSPASASALISSLSAANPDFTVSTLYGSSAAGPVATASPGNAAVEASGGTNPVSLSLFTTTPTALPTSSEASIAAVPTSAGSGYRVRRSGRSF